MKTLTADEKYLIKQVLERVVKNIESSENNDESLMASDISLLISFDKEDYEIFKKGVSKIKL